MLAIKVTLIAVAGFLASVGVFAMTDAVGGRDPVGSPAITVSGLGQSDRP